METVNVVIFEIHPYAKQTGKLEIPADIPEERIKEYVTEHFMEAKLSNIRHDYKGCDIEIIEKNTVTENTAAKTKNPGFILNRYVVTICLDIPKEKITKDPVKYDNQPIFYITAETKTEAVKTAINKLEREYRKYRIIWVNVQTLGQTEIPVYTD